MVLLGDLYSAIYAKTNPEGYSNILAYFRRLKILLYVYLASVQTLDISM